MADNPYSAPDHAGESPVPRPRGRFTVVELLVVIGVIAVLVGLLLPMRRSARPAAYRMQCSNNLKEIGLALRNYESAYDTLPPAYTVDDEGQPLHSWRTLILPFLEQQTLYEQIDLTKPWDHEANAEARQSTPLPYRCPASSVAEGLTDYLAVVGPGACMHPTRGRLLSEITDGLSDTMVVLEVPAEDAVHWMSPRDADESLVLGIDSDSALPHAGGVNIALADGSVMFLTTSSTEGVRRSLMTIAAGDEIE